MKNTLWSILCLLILVLGASTCAQAQVPSERFKERLDPAIAEAMEHSHAAGLAVGIVLDGRLVYARGFGVMNIDHPERKVTPETLFHMASITKVFVATAVMQLVEKGKVDLDAPVTKYLPYFKVNDPRYTSITVRHMLTHSSGMPDTNDYEWKKPQYDDGALERYVRSLSGAKLRFDPGTRMAYSNIAYEVLGDLVAKVSGMSFEDYVDANILKPLGMNSSTLLLKRANPAKLADGYTGPRSAEIDTHPRSDESGKLVPVPAYPYNRAHTPSSNLLSNVVDMARWAMANLNRGELDGKRILKNATYDLMWKPAFEGEFCRGPNMSDCRKLGRSIGIGWWSQQKNGHLIVFHDGGDDGFITNLTLIPDRHMAYIAMSNSDWPSVQVMKTAKAEAFHAAEIDVSK